MKSQIVRELGEGSVLLPGLVAEGLAANDRIKVRLSALQAAAQHAQHPDVAAADLSAEGRAADIAPTTLTALIAGAQRAGETRFTAPHLAELIDDIGDDAAAMIHAVTAGRPAEGAAANARLAAICAAGLLESTGELDIAQVARLTGVQEGSDSLHRLVLDLHKMLNGLMAECAEEVVAGAHVFGLENQDRSAVESFMRGVNETRTLKFNHPGLDTMAIRSRGRLVIQNDVGTTDAHVVVIAVEEDSVTVTYTDVHLPRAKFFVAQFRKYPAQWSELDRHAATGLGEDGTFFLVTGRYQAAGQADRDEFLASVGASLVFLIDWNKARKLLRNYVAKDDAVRILDWAARHRIGHRGLLELGGHDLITRAVRNAASSRIGFGERLDEALGRAGAIEFLKSALREAVEALRAGHSVRVARDRMEAELVRHLRRVESTALSTVLRQVGLANDLAGAIVRHIDALCARYSADAKRLAERAARIEQKADRIAVDARQEVARLNVSPRIRELIDRAEATIDELEQAAFIASLAPKVIDATLLSALSKLSMIALTATEAAASGLVAASQVPEGHRDDSEEGFAAVTRLIDAEHAADDQERTITALVLGGNFDLPTSLSVLELARAVERATDRLAGFGHLLREHIMADLSA
jgi:uncharacterized protein Yka (UPF0111/DUF47 family)